MSQKTSIYHPTEPPRAIDREEGAPAPEGWYFSPDEAKEALGKTNMENSAMQNDKPQEHKAPGDDRNTSKPGQVPDPLKPAPGQGRVENKRETVDGPKSGEVKPPADKGTNPGGTPPNVRR